MLITMAKTLSAATKLDWSFFLIIYSCVQLCCPHTTAPTNAYSDQAFQHCILVYFLTEQIQCSHCQEYVKYIYHKSFRYIEI